MRESTTYQAILREGRQEGKVEGEQELLLRQGTKRFGEPDAATIAALEAIQDIDRLGALANGFLTRTSKIGTTCYGPLDPGRYKNDELTPDFPKIGTTCYGPLDPGRYKNDELTPDFPPLLEAAEPDPPTTEAQR